MSYQDVKDRYRTFSVPGFLDSVDERAVESVLAKDRLTELDFLALLSGAASRLLEPMAHKAHDLTRRHFGNVMAIFTPMYISNFCDNACTYCSFARANAIDRHQLTLDEIREEAGQIARSGIRHVLVLTGECRSRATIGYLQESLQIISSRFSSVGIEIYPLTEGEYGSLIACGVDSLTIYQEVYDEAVYRRVHEGGPKSNYRFRLDAPERACARGIRAVNIGALLGLSDWRCEAFFTALHLAYLQDRFPATEVSVSLPRIRPLVAEFSVPNPVDDRQFVQLLLAFRIFRPSIGITVSTRESREFRNALLPLGVTRMSAGVSTAVGGRSGKSATGQFEIDDARSVEELKRDLLDRGYQPVMHDWNARLLAASVG